jgi:phage shock protein E
MKKIKQIGFLAALALTLAACAGSGVAQNVGASEFIEKIKEPGVVIVDVRTADEFNSGHLQGALNLDVSSPLFDAEIAALDKSVTYAIYCRSGNRSTVAAGKMSDAGFTNLINFNKGGYAELARAGAETK